jgi:hypothetical protein
MQIVHIENKTRSLGNVTPCYLFASCESFRGNYCPYLEGRRVSHVEKQDIGMGKARKGERLGLGQSYITG